MGRAWLNLKLSFLLFLLRNLSILSKMYSCDFLVAVFEVVKKQFIGLENIFFTLFDAAQNVHKYDVKTVGCDFTSSFEMYE